MSSYTFWNHLKMFDRMRRKKAQNDICSYKEFCEVINRERSRADRDNHGFSVVCFDIKCTEENGLSLEYLIKLLIDRGIRNTDEVGWFGKRCIGVALYNTTAEGAWSFANNVIEEFGAIRPYGNHTLTCKVYTYPSDWRNIDNATKIDRNVGSKNTSSQKNSTASKSPILFEKEVMNGSEKLECQQVSIMDEDCTSPVEKLERIFIRRISNIKRAVDIAGSTICLVIFSPIMLIIAIGIKLESKGPIFFEQKRTGLGGKVFTFYKFRSMNVDAEYQKKHLSELNERTGPVFKITKDPRITAVGKHIRRWSLDELPQLFNVLKGDMSMVGPRPLPHHETKECDNWHSRRLEVKPGITCIWQIYARHNKCFDTWVRMDIEYVRKQSLLLDLKILLLTIPAVISGKGAC